MHVMAKPVSSPRELQYIFHSHKQSVLGPRFFASFSATSGFRVFSSLWRYWRLFAHRKYPKLFFQTWFLFSNFYSETVCFISGFYRTTRLCKNLPNLVTIWHVESHTLKADVKTSFCCWGISRKVVRIVTNRCVRHLVYIAPTHVAHLLPSRASSTAGDSCHSELSCTAVPPGSENKDSYRSYAPLH